MHWPVMIIAYALWAGMMVWALARTRASLALSLVIVSGYVLLPVPMDLPLSAILGVKTMVVGLVGAAGLLIARRGEPGSWGESVREERREAGKKWGIQGGLKWWDICILLWPVAQAVSDLVNHQPAGSITGVAADPLVQWVLPYWIGRIVFRRAEDFEDLAKVIVWAAMVLTPLALYEVLFHPTLHDVFYGAPLVENPAKYPLILNRWGPANWRPELFFEGSHLASSFYFAAAALVQGFLMVAGAGAVRSRLWNAVILLVLMATVFNSRAFLGSAVLVAAAALLFTVAVMHTRVALALLVLALPVYVGARASGLWKTPQLMQGTHADPLNKNYSLWYRMFTEDMALQIVHERHADILGLGSTIPGGQGWRLRNWGNTNLVKIPWVDPEWGWLILRSGWVGLTVAYLAVAGPLLMGLRAAPLVRRERLAPGTAAFLALIAVVGLDLLDWAMNPHAAILWAFALGGVASMAAGAGRRKEPATDPSDPLSRALMPVK